MSDRSSQSPSESPFTARGAITQTKEILASTNQATRKVLSQVSNSQWWKKTLHSLRREDGADRLGDTDRNEKFEHQGCHPFFEEAIEDCYINVVSLLLQTMKNVYLLDNAFEL